MRIISGEFGGRTIASPEGRVTRPMLDRVREAMFSKLGGRVRGARVLDLFAGTGSLGLEAISRGAQGVRFLERDRRALRFLYENVSALGVEDLVEIVQADALRPGRWSATEDDEPWAAIVFADPPYPLVHERLGRRKMFAAIETLSEDVLVPGGVIVLHTHPRDAGPADFPEGFDLQKREYGRTALWYVTKPEGGEE